MSWSQHPAHQQYEVSSLGLVRRIGKVQPRKTRLDRNGYERLNVSIEGACKTVHVHTLVAEAFLGVAPGMTVNHKDGNKRNNAVGNLEWVSSGANTSHSFKTGQRVHKRCLPVVVDGRRFYSKREAERVTGIPRRSFKDGPHIELDRKAYA